MVAAIPYIALAVVLASAFLVLRLIWEMKRRIVISITRQTATDGETVAMTTTVPAGLSGMQISDSLEKMVVAVEARLINRNELVARTEAEIAHTKWVRIKKKMDDAAASRRTGPGVLSKEERMWWAKHGSHFDEHGPLLTADVPKAAAMP